MGQSMHLSPSPEPQPAPGRRCSAGLDAMNVLKSFVGANFLVMPFAFAKGGLLLGTVLLFFLAFLTDRCCSNLVKCKRRAVQNMVTRSGGSLNEDILNSLTSYGDVAQEGFGPFAKAIINVSIAFTQTGFCIQYFAFIFTTIHSFCPTLPQSVIATMPLAVVLPCALLPSVSSLAAVSGMANVATMIGYIVFTGYVLHDPNQLSWEGRQLANWDEAFVFFSVIMSCFEGMGTVLSIESSMKSGSANYVPMLHGAIVFATFFLGSFGLMGILRYGADVAQIATENLPDDSMITNLVRMCLLVSIVCTFPLQFWPVIQFMERLCLGGATVHPDIDEASHLLSSRFDAIALYGPIAGRNLALTLVLRIVLLLVVLVVALLLADYFGYISALIGALGATTLSFIMPCLLHLRFFRDETGYFTKAVDIVTIQIGVVGGGVGLFTTVMSLVKKAGDA